MQVLKDSVIYVSHNSSREEIPTIIIDSHAIILLPNA